MHKVMIVEDEEMIRKGLRKLIEEVIGGFTVISEASNGVSALENIKRGIPDLIITDIRMPQMDGIELIKRLRSQYPAVSLVILSGHGEFEYAKKQAIRYDVTDYLLKPIDRVELAQVLETLKKRWNAENGANPGDQAASGPEIRVPAQRHHLIRKAEQLIYARLGEEISLHSIAETVHMNAQYLSVLFKKETGESFSEYVKSARIDKAKQLLKATNLKIYEIANICGYDNEKYFMSVFKQTAGVTPSEFRGQ
jgi:two-component system response regulator YesN